MESGYVTINEVIDLLTHAERVSYKLALYRDATGAWREHALLLDVVEETADSEPRDPFAYDYGDALALGGAVPGAEVAGWLACGRGHIDARWGLPGITSLDFELPPIVSPETLLWQRHSSGTTYNFTVVPWPFTEYHIARHPQRRRSQSALGR